MEITRTLARFVVSSRAESVPEPAQREATRSLVNWLACALGGAAHDAVERAIAALQPFAGPPQAHLIGRHERFDCPHAALINGMSSHVLDFDDTHLRTLLHPSVAVAAPLLALAGARPISGAAFLHAFVLGVDVGCRIANAIYRSHNVNCYITGTAGVFGAAAAIGRVLALDEQQMTWAFGIAATQAAGLREVSGTMSKSFVHGRAAQNGMSAALLAAAGFTSTESVLEAPRGFLRVLAGECDAQAISAGLGESYEILLNSYKPYACGVVCHAAIDGCIRLRAQHSVDPAAVKAVSLRVHPLALKLAGATAPPDALQSKWSLYHSAAAALVDGTAGEHQYTDARVHDPAVRRVRGLITASADESLREDEAHVAIALLDGTVLERHVDHAIGSVARPMSDRDLERKFRDLAVPVLGPTGCEAVMDRCWNVARLPDVAELARMTVPARKA